jgi:ABC-2 type transport system ATP-binding protein
MDLFNVEHATGRNRMIHARGLVQTFSTKQGRKKVMVQAVDGVDLDVAEGEVVGFLGPNGAGKTTTIRMMMGILVPSGGRALIQGLDCHSQRAEVQRHVGYLPDNPIYYDFLRGREILRFVAEMHGMARAEAEQRAVSMLAEFGLTDVVDEFAVNYSMGMKKKLGLACALIHDPQVLILDEPINGLDPRAARDVQDRLRQAAAAGKTIFMSTHLLDMAEKVCSRVGIIHRGALVATGTMSELRQRVQRNSAVNDQQNASLEEVFLKVTDEDLEPAPADPP